MKPYSDTYKTIGSYMRQGQKPVSSGSWIKPRLMEQAEATNPLKENLLWALRTWWVDGDDDSLINMLHQIRSRHQNKNL